MAMVSAAGDYRSRVSDNLPPLELFVRNRRLEGRNILGVNNMEWRKTTLNMPEEDGYTVIPPLPKPPKGVKCGQCGIRFDHGKSYGYVCYNDQCPLFSRIRSTAVYEG